MSDLATLTTNMGAVPSYGAYAMGRSQSQARTSVTLKQEELKALIAAKLQEQEQGRQMNPLLLEQQRNKNMEDGIKMPGFREDVLTKQLTNRKTQATQDGDIAATQAKNAGTVDSEQAKLRDRFMEFLTEAGGQLDGVEPVMRVQTLTEMMKANKMNVESPMAKQFLQQLSKQDANNIPKYLNGLATQIGQAKAQASPAYHQAVTTTGMTNTTSEKTHAANNATQLKLEGMRQAGQDKRAQLRTTNKGTPDFWTSFYKIKGARNQHSALVSEAAKRGADDPDTATMVRMADAIRPQALAEIARAQAVPGSANLESVGIEANPDRDIAPPGAKPPASAPVSGKLSTGMGFRVVN